MQLRSKDLCRNSVSEALNMQHQSIFFPHSSPPERKHVFLRFVKNSSLNNNLKKKKEKNFKEGEYWIWHKIKKP